MFGLRGSLEITAFCSLVKKNDEHHFFEYAWSEPRNIEQISISPSRLDENKNNRVNKAQVITKIEYWKVFWPEKRQLDDRVDGSGQSGWSAQDDWYNGTWKQADACFAIEEHEDAGLHRAVYTFHAINAREFPKENLDVTYRRTLKIRVYFDKDEYFQRVPSDVHVHTDSSRVNQTFVVSSPRATSLKDPTFIASSWNGYFLNEWEESRETRRTCTFDKGFSVAAGISGLANASDETIITIDVPACGKFSFKCSDVEKHGRVLIPDLEMLVQHEGQEISYKEAIQRWITSRQVDVQESPEDESQSGAFSNTIYDSLFKMDEQKLHHAMERFSGKQRMHFVLGCDGTRAKCALSRSGNIFISNRYLLKVPGPDTRQVFWKKQYYKVGFKFSVNNEFFGPDLANEIADRVLLDRFLPIITSQWNLGPITVVQEAFATQLNRTVPGKQPMANDNVVVMVCFKIKNHDRLPQTINLHVITGEVTAVDDTEMPSRVFSDVYFNPTSTINAKMIELSGNGVPSYFMHVHHGETKIENHHDGFNPFSLKFLLEPQEEQVLYFRVPLLAISSSLAISALDRLDFDKERVRVAIYWMDRMEIGASIETPEAHFNRFYKAHLTHVLMSNDREIGTKRIFGRVGSLNYGTFANEACMICFDLDRRGLFDDARRILDVFLEYQGTAGLHGDYEDIEGIFFGANGYECGEGYNQNQGFVLWAIAEHVRMSGDVTWLKDIAPKVIKACDWITRERHARAHAMASTDIIGGVDKELLAAGLLPPGGVEDVKDFWDWLSTNAYNAFGMVQAADVLMQTKHPDAKRIAGDAMVYLQAVRDAFCKASTLSPVVALHDDTFVPHFPCKLPLRGRGYGWIQETLEGAMHLIRCWIVHPCSREATWILKDYEDNLFLSDRFGYAISKDDFKREWFTLGGFSQQPFLLCNQYPYLQRGEMHHYLRAVINAFSVNYRDDTVSFCEHPLPTIMDVRGDFFKTSDEANFCGCLRDMLVLEVKRTIYMEHFGNKNHEFTKRSDQQFGKHGHAGGWEAPDALALFQGTPREWLQPGKEIHVKKLPTYFGVANVDLASHVDEGNIEISILIEKPENAAPWKNITGFFITTRHPDKEETIMDVKARVLINEVDLDNLPVQRLVVKNQSFFVDVGTATGQWNSLGVHVDVLFKKRSTLKYEPEVREESKYSFDELFK